MRPDECEKFLACNASLCPLDERWRAAAHLSGEKVCPHLLASGKAGAAERFAGDRAFLACLDVLPEVCERQPDIRRRVEVAARSGFRKSNLPHLRQAAAGESGVLCEGLAATKAV